MRGNPNPYLETGSKLLCLSSINYHNAIYIVTESGIGITERYRIVRLIRANINEMVRKSEELEQTN